MISNKNEINQKQKKVALVIRWIARLWGSISLVFMLLFVGAHIISTITGKGEPTGKFNSVSEMISFAFFPVSIIIGLSIAWKWEGLGGLITIAGIICFHIIRPDLIFNLMIDGLAAPGLFFVLYWFLSRRLIQDTVLRTNIMKVILIFILVFIFCGSLIAQEINAKETEIESIRKNSIYFEILGSGAVYSINYDRIIPLKKKIAMFLRIGGNQYHGKDTNTLSFNFLGASGILYGGQSNFLDTGIGYTYFSGSPDRLIALMCGYRFQGKKGFSFRATPMYIYNSEKGDTFGNCLWFGLSFGYSF